MAELDVLRASVLAALAGGQTGRGVEIVGRVCRACVRLLPVDGAAVSVMADAGRREVVYTSNAVSAALAELQFSLGEGPCFESYSHGSPVLVPDLAAGLPLGWPVFAAQAAEYPVAALFTFPVQIGVVRVATLDTYRGTPGSLTDDELSTALQVADLAALALSGLLDGDRWLDGNGQWMEGAGMRHREVHQATGMLIAQLDLPAGEALARMRAYAFGHGRALRDVAADIVAGRLELDQEPW
ncbi:GAF domain-containing protein [Amycolatopsis tolypomycina]|uniref:GAF domain-containing protein n=1 Tax=Amycolatopsis tolypomycina TaxID=208445 RepID=A0A1H5CA78_9PSEU|nr:GAF and ANTAR domain-containing protein [Amycolatopsis tolypomycina]SED63378.1 GAF domain-containing protein [Amycolatopsis tolypomycina]